MALFKGQAEYSVDGKGRVALPAKMRRAVNPEANETFVVTRGLDRYIAVFPLDNWAHLEDGLKALNPYNREHRRFTRHLLQWADEASLDAQGRITIPKVLLSYAGVAEKAAIIGNRDHLEIWNPETLDADSIEDLEDYQDLAERVMGNIQM